MKRRKAREYALQILFREDFATAKGTGGVEAFWLDRPGEDTGNAPAEVMDFANDLARGAIAKRAEIDQILAGTAENWELGRMAAVDRNILRLGTYELVFRLDIPPAVSINEAIEIAKKFSTMESAAFINGVLDRISKAHRGVGKR